ncbi:hypothetical protein EVAR_79269_1 [Eumeta japonica]|uniref:Uncharacterized protein n=1 Tax=Eumeta variegata TaxID=151549 RepID=A0A4C1TEG0_EUMVA|nr:hypothetical protein EVAR_79269_1 [Eumeta japonica]
MPFFSGRCLSTARLAGETALVTGCNTGIGKETVLDFYKRECYRGERPCDPSEDMTWAPPLMDTRNSKGVASSF